jgi:hypothetical protein
MIAETKATQLVNFAFRFAGFEYTKIAALTGRRYS